MALHADEDGGEGNLIDHLIELRMRLMRGLAGTGIVLLCLLPFANKLYGLLAQPLLDKLPEGAHLIAIEVASPFFAPLKLAFFTALVVTVDTPVAGNRLRDPRNGTAALLSGNPVAMLPHVAQVLVRPRWLAGFLGDGGLMQFPNVVMPDTGPMKYESVGPALAQSVVTWADLAWIRELWQGPIIVKGVLIGDDARRAADAGAQAVIVSNHGGRQLDGAPATIAALPRIADAAGDRIEILFDGGVRSGQDVLKALALGAHGCLIGRAYLYGLAAMGGDGVRKALSLIEQELKVSMSLTGVRDVRDASPDILFDHYDGSRR